MAVFVENPERLTNLFLNITVMYLPVELSTIVNEFFLGCNHDIDNRDMTVREKRHSCSVHFHISFKNLTDR